MRKPTASASLAALLLLSGVISAMMGAQQALASHVGYSVTFIPTTYSPFHVAANPSTGMVYLASGSLLVVDGDSDSQVANIPLGTSPNDMAVNPETNLIYLAAGTSVTVVDGSSYAVVSEIQLDGYAGFVGVNPDTNRIYVSHGSGQSFSDQVSVIDGSANEVIASITLNSSSFGDIAANPQTNMIYVVNQYADTLSVVDGNSSSLVSIIPVGSHPFKVAVNPETNMVYVANYVGDTLSVIDGLTNNVVATVPVGGYHPDTTGSNPYGVDVDPVTNTIYVVNQYANAVNVIDGDTNNVTSTIYLSDLSDGEPHVGPREVSIDPNTGKAYVTVPGRSPGAVAMLQQQDLPHEDALPDDGSLACDNRYDATITSLILDNGVQQHDPLLTPDITVVASVYEGYSATAVVRAAEQSSLGNAEPGMIALQHSSSGEAEVECVGPVNPGEYVEFAISGIIEPGAEPGELQSVFWSAAPGSGTHYYVHWDTAAPMLGRQPFLTVKSAGMAGDNLPGFYTTLAGDSQVRTGFTPVRFNLDREASYVVTPSDYGDYAFDHWYDNGDTARARTVSITGDIGITAVYRDINEQPLPEPESPPSPPSQEPDATITILEDSTSNQTGSAYQPSNVTIPNNATVVWVNQDSVPHTATSGQSPSDPDSGSIFDTGFIQPGNQSNPVIVYASSGVTTVPYYCTLHPWMTGVLNIESSAEPDVPEEEPPQQDQLPPTVTVRSVDADSNGEIPGYYATLSQNGVVVAAGFTPATFDVAAGETYEILVYDYGSYFFNYWQDSSEPRQRTITAQQSGEEVLTAAYGTSSAAEQPGETTTDPVPPEEPEETAEPADPMPSLMVWSREGHTGGRIDGYYAVLTRQDNGNIVTSFTPTSFELNSGVQYAISVYDYGQYVFDHWSDTGSTARERTVSLTSDAEVTAIYRDVDSAPLTSDAGTVPEGEDDSSAGDASPSTIRIDTVDASGSQILGYYVMLWQGNEIVQTWFSPAEFSLDSGKEYQVSVGDYGGYVFDHWGDGSPERLYAIEGQASLTAVYRN